MIEKNSNEFAVPETHLNVVGPAVMQFFLLKYAPNMFTDEGVNFAVILASKEFADIRVTTRLEQILSFDPKMDAEMLTALALEIQERLQTVNQRDEFLREMENSCSNLLRLIRVELCVTDDPASELNRLARLLL